MVRPRGRNPSGFSFCVGLFRDKERNATKGFIMPMKNTITEAVVAQITGLSPRVEASVVDVLVQRELTRRSEAIVQCFDKVDKLVKELRKVRPDQVVFDETGKQVAALYSKPILEARTKLEQQIEKIEKAIQKALDKQDFSDVYSLCQDKS